MNEGELCVLGGRSHEEHIIVKMTHGQEFAPYHYGFQLRTCFWVIRTSSRIHVGNSLLKERCS